MNISLEEHDERSFHGTWRVNKFEGFEEGATARNNENEIEGTELTLDEGYDVRWKIPTNVEAIPLFSCESYEVILTNPAQLTFVSSSVGRIGPFAAKFEEDELELTYDKAFILYCVKVPQSEQIQELPFSFQPALDNGYFSDLIITSSSGKNYPAHRVILKLGCPERSWESHSSKQSSYQACILDGLSDSALSTVLHYLYTESLPPGLSEIASRECTDAISKISGLEKLNQLCQSYLENYAVRTKIEHLCDELENCGRKINQFIRSKPESSQIQSDSASLWIGLKQAVREFAVAILIVLQICKLFSDHRNELSREERHRIMKHCKNRIPSLLILTSEFYEIVSSHLSKQTSEDRTEFASYFLTEAEPLFAEANEIISEIRKALEVIINSDTINKHRQKESIIAKTLKNAVHIKELAKLRRVHSKIAEFIFNLSLKKEHFSSLSREDKLKAASNVIECTTDEIPVFLDRLSDWHDNLDMKLSWTRWKYFFKMGVAKVAWFIEKSRYSRQSMLKALDSIRNLVQREDFDAGLVSLGLIDNVEKASSRCSQGLDKTKAQQSQDVESLCISPVPRDSVLSSHASQLFNSLDSANNFLDMKFIVHYFEDEKPMTKILKAHRVIVSCRCDWFRRALLSGMKEDIKREINIYECNPDLFEDFLRYLYTGRLDCNNISVDTLADMIALSDQYEVDSLKSVCEGALKPLITNENVLELLSIGEQFNASSLRECCMHHILLNPNILESEIFNELPPKLQIEIRDLTEWNQRDLRKKLPSMSSAQPRTKHRSPLSSQPTSPSETDEDLRSEMEMIDHLTHRLHLRQRVDSSDSEEEFKENVSYVEGRRSCVIELQSILGNEIPSDELERIAMAADFDVNRALNFYFSSQD
ncbi:uncharacterized protein LOC120341379 [Styela clava]